MIRTALQKTPRGQKRRKWIYLVLIFLILIITPIIVSVFIRSAVPFDQKAGIQSGSLDLTDIKDNSLLRLKGDWKFYWQQLVDYEDLQLGNHGDALEVEVPGVWNSYLPEDKHQGFGYASYVLHVTGVEPDAMLSLRLPTTATSISVFIDEEKVFQAGETGTSAAEATPNYRTGTASFVAKKSEFTIILHVSNFIYARGGLWHEPILGYHSAVENYNKTLIRKDYFLLGGLVLMSLFHFIVYIGYNNAKNQFYIFLLSTCAYLRILVSNNYHIYDFFPRIPFRVMFVIEYISFHWIAMAFLLLISSLFTSSYAKWFIRVLVVNASLLSLVTLSASVRFTSSIVNYAQLSVGVTLLLGLFITLRALFNFEKGAALILLCGYVGTLFSVHDIFFYNNIVRTHFGETTTLALFLSIVIQSFVVAVDYTQGVKQLQKTKDKLVRLDKLKNEFLYNTSHELRMPLNGVLALADNLMRGREGRLTTRQYDNVKLISTSLKRLTHLANNILDSTRLKHADITLNIQPIRLEGILASVVKIFENLGYTRNIPVILDIPDPLPVVDADEDRVAQIVYNLLGNALKFTDKGSITVRAITIGEEVVVQVIDTGIGIDEKQLEKILSAESPVNLEQGEYSSGYGIGLTISRQLVMLHNGSLSAQSEVGKGSIFSFSLPLSAEGSTHEPVSRVEPVFVYSQTDTVSNPEHKTMLTRQKQKNRLGSIILADDEPSNLQAASWVLESVGYEVILASNGEEVLKLLNKNMNVLLVIMDLIMPGMTGYEVCRVIREDWSLFEMPVLIMTGKTRVEDIVESLRSGANDFMPKPFEPEEFIARVNTLANLKQSVTKAMESEITLLQAQIKPHFLYNSLNTIISFCEEQPKRGAEVLLDLSEFLRASFDFQSFNTLVSLEHELQLVQRFVAIEKARFGSLLEFSTEIAQGLNAKIPVLIIQPLVENAIVHGIRKKDGIGKVTLSIQLVEDSGEIEISIQDNGIGMTKKQIVEIFNTEKHGIGLWNINMRLVKMYKKRLKIEQAPGTGLIVSFRVPQGEKA